MDKFREQLERFYRDNFDTLVRKVQNQYVSKHDAEDIIQEVFTRLLRFESTFDGQNFEGWFYTVLRNVIKDAHRERIMRGMSLDSAEEETVEADTESKITYSNVLSYINSIDNPNKKRIATYYLVDGLTYREIDQVVPENLAAVRKIVQRVREDIQEHVL